MSDRNHGECGVQMKSYVYAILDEVNSCLKIGKANDVKMRMADLQIGNPNPLKLVGLIECKNESFAFRVERSIQEEYSQFQIRGEWFSCENNNVLEEQFDKISHNDVIKKTRDSLIIPSLFENEVTVFDNEKFPRCFFYPERPAQIMTNYEDAQRLSGHSKWRTMQYPTDGKLMLKLLDGTVLSDKKDLVFISSRKHEENLKLNRFLKNKNSTAKSILEFV
jgi:hypothetical protein